VIWYWRRWRLRRRLRRVWAPRVSLRERDQMVDELFEVVDRVEHM
jgi:hypothetical protein